MHKTGTISFFIRMFIVSAILGFAVQAQLISNQYSTTWIGNTYANGRDHVPQNIYDISVAPDGTVFTDVIWDEGDYECTQFNSDGSINRPAAFTHGWGSYGGMAVACNSNYVFIAEIMIHEKNAGFDTNTWPAAGCKQTFPIWFNAHERRG